MISSTFPPPSHQRLSLCHPHPQLNYLLLTPEPSPGLNYVRSHEPTPFSPQPTRLPQSSWFWGRRVNSGVGGGSGGSGQGRVLQVCLGPFLKRRAEIIKAFCRQKISCKTIHLQNISDNLKKKCSKAQI